VAALREEGTLFVDEVLVHSEHEHDDLQVPSVVRISDDFVVKICPDWSSEKRAASCRLLSAECDLELLDTDLDLLTDCLGGSSTCAVEYTAAA
jgi:hypothetical protein